MEGYRTYTGLVVSAIGLILSLLKINITTEEIQPIVNALLEAGGLLYATYGRYKAKPKEN